MHRFWNAYTAPLIDVLQPKRLLEIGAEFGWNTRHLLDYCRQNGACLEVVETAPLKSLLDTLAPYTASEYALHVCKSTQVLADLSPVDFVLLYFDKYWR